MASPKRGDFLNSQQVCDCGINVPELCDTCLESFSNCVALQLSWVLKDRRGERSLYHWYRSLGSRFSVYSLPHGGSESLSWAWNAFCSVVMFKAEFWDPTFCVCGSFQQCFLNCNMHMNHLEIWLKCRFCFCRCSLRNYLDAMIWSWVQC